MLAELRIQDLAVIERLAVRLEPGLNVLTGETGAGKSIIVGALSLLLGERASSDVVRPGADRAVVEGVFEVASDSPAIALLEEQGIGAEDGLVILRREVASEGRNRAWINGAATTAGMVGRIGSLLVDLHGQSEHDDLVHVERQRAILDAFAGANDLAREVLAAHAAMLLAARAVDELEARRRDTEEQADRLRDRAEEIERASLEAGEEEALQAEARRLDHAEELARLATGLHELLYGAEDAVTARLDEARRLLAQLDRIDPEVGAGALDEAYFAVEDLGRRLGDYAADIEHDPARIDAIRTRQDLIFRLRSRYGGTIEDVIEVGRQARAALELLDSIEFERRDVVRVLAERRARLVSLAQELSVKRTRAAKKLASDVEASLPALGIPGGRFIVTLDPLPEPAGQGGETIAFLAALNAGFEPRPVARVASGGELSRLMLALKATLARSDRTPTLVFDEIDAGVGGRVAHAVALRLREVARDHQVFVVTHLAQIAARADHHLLVEKSGGRPASTDIRELSGDTRVRELARLLGGDPESAASLEHARELLSSAV